MLTESISTHLSSFIEKFRHKLNNYGKDSIFENVDESMIHSVDNKLLKF